MSGIEKRLTITDGVPSSRQRVELDGIDISNAIRGYTIRGSAGQLPEVTLDVLAVELETEGEPARIHISDDCRDLLIRFGWTPPAEDGKPRVFAAEDVAIVRGEDGEIMGYAYYDPTHNFFTEDNRAR